MRRIGKESQFTFRDNKLSHTELKKNATQIYARAGKKREK